MFQVSSANRRLRFSGMVEEDVFFHHMVQRPVSRITYSMWNFQNVLQRELAPRETKINEIVHFL